MRATLSTIAPNLHRLDGAPLPASRRAALAGALATVCREAEGALRRIGDLADAGDLDGAAFCLADLLDGPIGGLQALSGGGRKGAGLGIGGEAI